MWQQQKWSRRAAALVVALGWSLLLVCVGGGAVGGRRRPAFAYRPSWRSEPVARPQSPTSGRQRSGGMRDRPLWMSVALPPDGATPPPPPAHAQPLSKRQQQQQQPHRFDSYTKSLRRAVAMFNHILHLILSMGDIFGSYSTPPKSLAVGEGSGEVEDVLMSQYRQVYSGGPTLRPNQRNPKKVQFSTRYSCSVTVANASLIESYMSLPFDQYSLLDQAFISRVRDNVFRFMVPANELVGLQTVPIVDVCVHVDMERRLLNITSMSSKLVSRSPNGTIVSTYNVGLLQNNSLAFSTHISWNEPNQGGVPGRPLARLRKAVFRGRQGARAQRQRQAQDDEPEAAVEDPPTGPNVRRLRCTASVDVGVVVPPPLSLIPKMVLRQGASVILSTVVTTLVNRFLDLLIQDYQKWVLADGSRATGSLLGYQPDRYEDRSIEMEDDGKEDEEPVPDIEYMI